MLKVSLPYHMSYKKRSALWQMTIFVSVNILFNLCYFLTNLAMADDLESGDKCALEFDSAKAAEPEFVANAMKASERREQSIGSYLYSLRLNKAAYGALNKKELYPKMAAWYKIIRSEAKTDAEIKLRKKIIDQFLMAVDDFIIAKAREIILPYSSRIYFADKFELMADFIQEGRLEVLRILLDPEASPWNPEISPSFVNYYGLSIGKKMKLFFAKNFALPSKYFFEMRAVIATHPNWSREEVIQDFLKRGRDTRENLEYLYDNINSPQGLTIQSLDPDSNSPDSIRNDVYDLDLNQLDEDKMISATSNTMQDPSVYYAGSEVKELINLAVRIFIKEWQLSALHIELLSRKISFLEIEGLTSDNSYEDIAKKYSTTRSIAQNKSLSLFADLQILLNTQSQFISTHRKALSDIYLSSQPKALDTSLVGKEFQKRLRSLKDQVESVSRRRSQVKTQIHAQVTEQVTEQVIDQFTEQFTEAKKELSLEQQDIKLASIADQKLPLRHSDELKAHNMTSNALSKEPVLEQLKARRLSLMLQVDQSSGMPEALVLSEFMRMNQKLYEETQDLLYLADNILLSYVLRLANLKLDETLEKSILNEKTKLKMSKVSLVFSASAFDLNIQRSFMSASKNQDKIKAHEYLSQFVQDISALFLAKHIKIDKLSKNSRDFLAFVLIRFQKNGQEVRLTKSQQISFQQLSRKMQESLQ